MSRATVLSPVGAGLAALGGLAHAASLATPWNGQPLWPLQLLALALLAGLVQRAERWQTAAILGAVFGTAWLSATFGWLFTSMHTYGGLAAPLAAAAVLLLAAFLSLYLALACALFHRLKRLAGPMLLTQNAMVFAACWLLAELARGQWLTGFPWGASGYAHVDGPLAAYAPWLGVYGMGAVAALLASVLASLLTGHTAGAGRSWRPRLLGLLVLAVLGLMLPKGLEWRHAQWLAQQPSAGLLSLALLQGNIPQDEKFEPGTGVAAALQWYGQALQATEAQLVVAPETALPLLPQDMPAGYWEAVQAGLEARAQRGQAGAALIGTPLGSLRDGYTNSVLGLRPGGAEHYRYDKHHLVPFGEFIPPLFRWFTELMHIPLGDFNRGSVGQASMAWHGQRLAPNICYEDLFGEELAQRFADPAQAPTVLVNLSNLAWFGDGQAIDQHLQISRLRAIELARPMVRATNTGATVVIDYRGVVRAALPRASRGVLRTEVEGREGITLYATWAARWGLGPLWLLGAAVLLVAGLGRHGRSRRGAP